MKKKIKRTRITVSKKPNRRQKSDIIEMAQSGKTSKEIKGIYPSVKAGSVSALIARHGPNGHKHKPRKSKHQSIGDLRDKLLSEMEHDLQVAIKKITAHYRKLLG